MSPIKYGTPKSFGNCKNNDRNVFKIWPSTDNEFNHLDLLNIFKIKRSQELFDLADHTSAPWDIESSETPVAGID